MADDVQRLIFDILTRDRASEGFAKAGHAASAAAGDVSSLTKRLDEVGRKSATARVALAGNTEALAQLDRFDAKLIGLDRRTASPRLTVEGAARAIAEISAVDVELDKVGGKGGSAETAAASLGTSGLSGPSGMGALIGAGVALSPVIATLGVGLAGFGAAAVGVLKPIEDAASKTGGLQKNMKLLNPEQQAVARSLLGLGKQYQQFQNSLQPEVLATFGTGLHLVSGLMRDVQPVAKATGLAVDGLLTRVDTEFRSQTWQSFFGFMAKTAAPDMKLLGDTLINLTDTLPPLLRDLQPVATTILELTAVTTKGIDVTARLSQGIGTVGGAAKSSNPWLHALGVGLKYNTEVMFPFIAGTISAKRELDFISGASDKSKQALAGWSKTGVAGAIAAHGITTALNGMNAAVTTSISRILTLEGDQVSWKQAQQAATTAINQNHRALDGNSASALTARAAIIAATTQVIKFADDSNTSTGALRRGSSALQDQITWLEKHAGKSKIAAQEIQALREEEAKIKREIDQRIKVTGSGRFSVAGSGLPGGIGHRTGATGGRVPGFGGGDVHPYLLEGGEAIVPKHLTPAVAPFLKAQGVPGFAAGGLVPSYSGGVPGLGPWALGNTQAVLASLDKSVASATASALASAFASTGGPASYGVTRWAPLILKVLAMLGQSSANLGPVEHRMQQESGGNPYAINLTDSNAAAGDPSRGLMQTIGTTFAAYRSWSLPNNIYNPEANIFAGLNYALHAYAGRSLASVMLQPGGYDNGGWLMPGATLAVNKTGRPEQVIPPGGGELAGLLAEIADGIAELIAVNRSAPRAFGDTLNGAVRSGAYSSMYGSR